MTRLLLTLILVLNLIIQANGQSAGTKRMPLGLYFGGESYNTEMMGSGYYYFKPDSTFFFLSTTFNSKGIANGNLKNSYTDTLAGYGKGHWFIKDNFFIIKFETVNNYGIQNDEVRLHSFSRFPYDSTFITVQLENKIGQYPLTASITIQNTNFFTVTDTFGFAKIKLPFNYKTNTLIISTPEYFNKKIVLGPENNVHEISAVLSSKNEPYINVVPPFNFSYKIRFNEKNELIIGNLKKSDGGVDKLKKILKNGYSKMPMQKYFIDKVIKEMNMLKDY